MTEAAMTLTLVSFMDIESIFLWKNATFNDTLINSLTAKKIDPAAIRRLDEILIEEKTLSIKYDELMIKLGQKQNESLKLEISQRQQDELLSLIQSKFINLIKTVDNMHQDFIDHKFETKSLHELPKSTVQSLSKKLFELSRILDEIHKLLFPTFAHITPKLLQLILMDSEINLPYDCDKYTSTQQFAYFMYIKLIIIEMKGFSTLVYISSILQHTTEYDYKIEIEIAKRKFTQHVTDYHKNILKSMGSVPREIHRCEINPPQRNVNFIEFIKYHQLTLLTAKQLSYLRHLSTLSCIEKCEDKDHRVYQLMTETLINNCRTIGIAKFIETCPATPESSRKYMWWKYNETTYGPDESCPTAIKKGNGNIPYIEQCYICECDIRLRNNAEHKNAILNISVTPQVSDIENNMIVVGVKFVIHENVLHLQIQQSKFVLNEINDNSSAWKSLDDHRSSPGVAKIISESLVTFSGQLYLDDIMLPAKYAVTGLKFSTRYENPDGFHLEIHGTPFDMKTGKLIPKDAIWFTAHSQSSTLSDYDRDRFRLNTKNLDDPTRCTGYNYDRTTNNYIRFDHSSMIKDGGQSTVPFIDAQPVETYPPFPLGGIGLFYRNKEGCGGYITPRIFTIDISQYD
ncbi:hypothetical protein PV325_002225 [Microctonus aethiopoides]|nr:hypothetical protein PV325_002225 [Microctonus aethiopoides]